jgi:glycosyltransferase involved in cell wall biosynthesis/peptidoglycan/xylan/chitin deacetylase (PgdA/CDA1 family)
MDMERITILYMLDTLGEMAGSERNLYEIVTRLDKRKYRPVVVCFQGGMMADLLRREGVEVHDFQLNRIYTPLGLWKALRLMRLMRRQRVRIVVTYHESSDFLGSLAAKLAGVPVIISSRRDMGYSLKKRHLRLYRLINGLFDRIVTVSDAVKMIIHERENVLWYKMQTIYNGVDASKFDVPVDRAAVQRSLGVYGKWPVIGILAAVRPIKGHRYFLEAAALIRRRFPRAHFLVVGWHLDEPYFQRLQEMVGRLNLGSSVTFTGGRHDTPALLAAMDVSVFASINEGFSNAVLESMAAGKPVVATNSGGTPEAVVDGVTGLLVPPQDSRALADALISVFSDTSKAARMGAAGKTRVRADFGIDAMIRQTEGLYETLLEEKTAKRYALAFRPGQLRWLASRSIKQCISMALYYSGLIRMVREQDKSITILAYHRVTDNPFVLPGMSIKVANFERQMQYISRYHTPITLERAVEILNRKEPMPERAIVITFDDGYRDNYLNAFPILHRYGIPATIFLSVRAIEEEGILWFDTITEAFRLSPARSIDLSAYGLRRYALSDLQRKVTAANETVLFAKRYADTEREAFTRAVLDRLGVSSDDLRRNRLMMNWENVRAMRSRDISFGSHGMSHTILTRLTKEELESELAESKRLIQERAGIDAKLFAYPNGKASDFSKDMEVLLRKYGYLTACTLLRGLNNGESDSFMLKRRCVSEGMESNVFGRFCKPLFASALSGIF